MLSLKHELAPCVQLAELVDSSFKDLYIIMYGNLNSYIKIFFLILRFFKEYKFEIIEPLINHSSFLMDTFD